MWSHLFPGWAVAWIYAVFVVWTAAEGGILLPFCLWAGVALLAAGGLMLAEKRRGWNRSTQACESALVLLSGISMLLDGHGVLFIMGIFPVLFGTISLFVTIVLLYMEHKKK